MMKAALIALLLAGPAAFSDPMPEFQRLERENKLRELRNPPLSVRTGDPVNPSSPGFTSKAVSSGRPVGESALSAPFQNTYRSSVFLKLSCEEPGPLPVLIPFKFKEVVLKSKNEKIFKGGTYHTDADGQIKFEFSSEGDSYGLNLTLTVAQKDYEIKLGTGPYELIFPLRACKN